MANKQLSVTARKNGTPYVTLQQVAGLVEEAFRDGATGDEVMTFEGRWLRPSQLSKLTVQLDSSARRVEVPVPPSERLGEDSKEAVE